MINPAKFLKLKSTWERFAQNHPKFVSFIAALQNNYIKEGTVIEINVKTEEGKSICSNIRLNKDDIDMISELSELLKP
ncbi:MAG TPA: hypothetical protein PK304_01245 [Mobilitalea sp.]|nr:hypothetical protein [Mobilitalea sp.]